MGKKVQSSILDPEKICWDDENEVYIHASGVCYDTGPGVKAYYMLIDQ